MSALARMTPMPTRPERIRQLLEEVFHPVSLSVADDSAKHAGHAGAQPAGETHYSIEIVSNLFRGKSRVERHRMIYDALGQEFSEGLHALAVKTMTVDEQ